MFRAILLPVDLGHESSWEKAAPTAVALAREFGAKIHVLTVIPDFGMALVGSFFPKEFESEAMTNTQKELEALAKKIIPGELLASYEVARGTIYKEIIAVADGHGCDLIVLASHRPEMSDYLLGPNAARVVRHANQSVMVVRN